MTWRELITDHLRVRTDLDERCARAAARDLEIAYRAVRDLGFAQARPPSARLDVTLTSEGKLVEAWSTDAAGFYRGLGPSRWDGGPHVVVAARDHLVARDTFQHEVTHHFVRHSWPQAPEWLHEGMAEYFSSLELGDGYAWSGRPVADKRFTGERTGPTPAAGASRLAVFDPGEMPSVHRLASLDPSQFDARTVPGAGTIAARRHLADVHYLAAWVLVHLLRNGPDDYNELFDRYLALLAAGWSSDGAWLETLGRVPSDRLEFDYRAFMMRSKTTILRTPYTLPTLPPPAEREMSEAEVHVLLAKLYLQADKEERRERAQHEIAAALSREPSNPEALLLRSVVHAKASRHDEAVADAARAREGRPGDVRFARTLAAELLEIDVLGGVSSPRWDRIEPLLHELERSSDPDALCFVASIEGLRNAPARGLPAVARAIALAPVSWECRDAQATLLYEAGQVDRAAEAEAIATNLLPTQVSHPEYFQRLRFYRRASADSRAAPDPTRWEPPALELAPRVVVLPRSAAKPERGR